MRPDKAVGGLTFTVSRGWPGPQGEIGLDERVLQERVALDEATEAVAAQIADSFDRCAAKATPQVEAIHYKIRTLPPEDQRALFALWARTPGSIAHEAVGYWQQCARESLYSLASGLTAEELGDQLERRTRKPGKRDRDQQIVHLHEEKALTFGQIAQRFGMKKDAVTKAYYREKERGQDPGIS
jgi:hypothetical protein